MKPLSWQEHFELLQVGHLPLNVRLRALAGNTAERRRIQRDPSRSHRAGRAADSDIAALQQCIAAQREVIERIPTEQCHCGAAYNRAEWQQLELLGAVDPELLERGEHAEQRNCACGSTLTLEMISSCVMCEDETKKERCPATCTCICHG